MIVLGVLLLLVWGRVFFGKPPRPAHNPLAAAASSPKAEIHPLPVQKVSKPAPNSEWGGSPFEMDRKASTSSSSDVPLVSSDRPSVSGILWDPRSPSAVVNGQLVGVGDQVGNWRVMEIRKDKVILSDGVTQEELNVQ